MRGWCLLLQLGLLGPLEFLPEAEAFGLMGAITELVLQEACVQLSRWRKGGLELNSCINLAPSLLRDRELPARYEEIVREHRDAWMGPELVEVHQRAEQAGREALEDHGRRLVEAAGGALPTNGEPRSA